MSAYTILVAEDDQPLRSVIADVLHDAGYQVVEAIDGTDALSCIESNHVDMVLTDIQMDGVDGHTLNKRLRQRGSTIPVMMMTAFGTVQDAVSAIHEGVADYIVKPFDADLLLDKIKTYLPLQGRNVYTDTGPVAVDPNSLRMVETASRIAESDVTALLLGESGTGKEVIARYIHAISGRQGPFVAINCAAIPENMLEAMLFGYERGAFTGAHKSTPGKFEAAQHGTLLLDEISEMPLSLQAKFLRVLQEREIERLGSNKCISLDVRVIATSNRDLKADVACGRFREDLFYRLSVLPIVLPPLRERPRDILPIANHFLSKVEMSQGASRPELSKCAQSKLLHHNWPGNIRELGNVIQRACVLAQSNILTERDIHLESEMLSGQAHNASPDGDNVLTDATLVADLKSHEQQIILEALMAEHGSRKRVAEKLGISPRTLRYKIARMKASGISIPPSTLGVPQ